MAVYVRLTTKNEYCMSADFARQCRERVRAVDATNGQMISVLSRREARPCTSRATISSCGAGGGPGVSNLLTRCARELRGSYK
jgi:hypothetical protein